MQVPQDIIDCILAELADNIQTLLTCSLVSHSFLPTSRRYIYSTLDLVTWPDGEHRLELLKNMEQFLVADSNTALAVRRLKFPMSRDFPIGILAPLSLLQSLTIHFSPSFQWNAMSNAIQSTIRISFQSTSLVSITMTDACNIPMSIFSGCPQLKSLSFADVTPASHDVASLPASPSLYKGQLHCLDAHRSHNALVSLTRCLRHPRSTLGMEHIRVLRASIFDDADVDCCQQIIDLSKETIEELEVIFYFHNSTTTLNIAKLNHLRCLRLKVVWGRANLGMLHFLQGIAQPSRIEEIHLNLDGDAIQSSVWEGLNAILSNTRLPHLDRVVIKLLYQDYLDPDVLDLLRQHAPALCARGILSVHGFARNQISTDRNHRWDDDSCRTVNSNSRPVGVVFPPDILKSTWMDSEMGSSAIIPKLP